MWDLKSSFTLLDPVDVIVDCFFEHKSILNKISNLSHNLPEYLEDRKIREELVCELRNDSSILELIKNSKDRYLDERIFQIYCYFSNAYVNALYENQSDRIPFEISFPLIRISNKLKRKSFLSYHSYCLYNYKNNALIQKFTKEKEEDDFLLSLVESQIEFDKITKKIMQHNSKIDYKYCKSLLSEIYSFLEKLNISKPSDKIKWLMRPYNVIAEGCDISISSFDRFFFICVLECLFIDNIDVEKYNVPFSHNIVLRRVIGIRNNFNNYLKNESKYKMCMESFNDLMLKYDWK